MITKVTNRHFRVSIKRIGLISMLAAIMMLPLAACGGTTDSGSQSGATQVVPAATDTASSGATGGSTAATPAAIAAATDVPQAITTDAAGTTDMTDGTMTATDSTNAGASATPATGSQAGSSGGSATEVQGTLREWAIDLSQKEVPAGKVRFVVTNQGQFAHNFTVTDSNGTIGKTPDFRSADGAQTLEVDLKPGTYTILCTMPGHAARGQKTELVVK